MRILWLCKRNAVEKFREFGDLRLSQPDTDMKNWRGSGECMVSAESCSLDVKGCLNVTTGKEESFKKTREYVSWESGE